jgi:hypothetical protein
VARLEEEGLVEVVRVPSEPGSECLGRLAEAARGGGGGRVRPGVWVSQVFFNSGHALDMEGFAALGGASACW